MFPGSRSTSQISTSIHQKKSNVHIQNLHSSIFVWGLVAVSYPNINTKDDYDNQREWRKSRIISNYISLAEEALKDGEMSKAEKILRKALEISGGINTVGITIVYEMLATICFKKGDKAEAIYLVEDLVRKLSNSNSSINKNLSVNYNLKLARMYEREGQYDLAELTFRNCVEKQKTKYMKGDDENDSITLWINSLFWYGKFLAQRNRFAEAYSCFENAYFLIPHVKSFNDKQVMVVLFNMGGMSFASGNLDEALQHLVTAVIIGKTANSPDLPIIYTKIGLSYLHQGLLNEAKKWCVEALKTNKNVTNKYVRKESSNCLEEIDRMFKQAKINNQS